MSKITISISRTVQVQQYEPLTISLQREVEIPEDLSGKDQQKFELQETRSLGKVLEVAMEKELDRYRQ